MAHGHSSGRHLLHPVDVAERFGVNRRTDCNASGSWSVYRSTVTQTEPENAMKRKLLTPRATIAASLAAALTTFAFATMASASEMARSADGIAIKYSQDELNTPADAERIYSKLKLASQRACGLGGGFLNLSEKTRAQKCYDETLAAVVQKIDRPLLTQLHDSKSNKVG
jgi:UrcA family protein